MPTVASRTGGIPDVIEDGVNGMLVEPADPEALARAIDRVLAERGLAHRLSEGARKRGKDYDWGYWPGASWKSIEASPPAAWHRSA